MSDQIQSELSILRKGETLREEQRENSFVDSANSSIVQTALLLKIDDHSEAARALSKGFQYASQIVNPETQLELYRAMGEIYNAHRETMRRHGLNLG